MLRHSTNACCDEWMNEFHLCCLLLHNKLSVPCQILLGLHAEKVVFFWRQIWSPGVSFRVINVFQNPFVSPGTLKTKRLTCWKNYNEVYNPNCNNPDNLFAYFWIHKFHLVWPEMSLWGSQSKRSFQALWWYHMNNS